ncbi:MAG: DUF983 domain-containing protein [Hyphomicrobiaceae bacterium]
MAQIHTHTGIAAVELSAANDQTLPQRDVVQSLSRGARLKCPSCGEGKIFKGYLKVADSCDQCGQELHHHRADDAPPYFTMLIVGHIIVGGVLSLETAYAPPSWVHGLIWLPALLILSLAMLPPIKGALVGLQWALRMHGFSGQEDRPADEIEPHSA